jgi:hypothetical protein
MFGGRALGSSLQGFVFPGDCRSPWALPRAVLARPFGPLKMSKVRGAAKREMSRFAAPGGFRPTGHPPVLQATRQRHP